jgi:hypothetical protein
MGSFRPDFPASGGNCRSDTENRLAVHHLELLGKLRRDKGQAANFVNSPQISQVVSALL